MGIRGLISLKYLFDFVGDLLLLGGDLGGTGVEVALQPAAHVDHVVWVQSLQDLRITIRRQREGSAHHRQKHGNALKREIERAKR